MSVFRSYLPDLSLERFQVMQQQDAHQYATCFKQSKDPPWLHALWEHWVKLSQQPFIGITSDGSVEHGLYTVQDEGVMIDEIVYAAQHLYDSLDDAQRKAISFHIDSPEWRTWSNPELLFSDKGIRLDQVSEDIRSRSLALLKSSLSEEGFHKAVSAMRINGFLGQLVGAQAVMNENSYNLAVFGKPSSTNPWGFSFYGHHLCLNMFFYRTQIIISPWFTGAEPNIIDEGLHAGTKILQKEQQFGLDLMQQLTKEQQRQAQVFQKMQDQLMPPGRWNKDDQRHLCGAYRDNRVVPYEGVRVAELSAENQTIVTKILAEYLLYLPGQAREIQLARIARHYHKTYFSWIGDYTDDSPFYYRIQSPVILIEFDHHSGVFLNNGHPARFHIHTILRTPNAGDYGRALLPLTIRPEQAFVWNESEPDRRGGC